MKKIALILALTLMPALGACSSITGIDNEDAGVLIGCLFVPNAEGCS